MSIFGAIQGSIDDIPNRTWSIRTIYYSWDPPRPPAGPDRANFDKVYKILRDGMDWWEDVSSVRFSDVGDDAGKKVVVKMKWNQGDCSVQPDNRTEGGKEKKLALFAELKGCLNRPNPTGSAAHEMGHVLGLQHEHSLRERELYLNVKTEVLKRAREYAYHARNRDRNNFEQNYVFREIAQAQEDLFKAYVKVGKYDLQSIMHYPARIDVAEKTIDYWLTAKLLGAAMILYDDKTPDKSAIDYLGNRACISAGDKFSVQELYGSKPLTAD